MRTKALCLFAGACILSLPHFAQAQTISADFTGGNGSAGDQYPGSAGNGWDAGWILDKSGGGTQPASATVTNASPLAGGGNYLSMTMTGSSVTNTDRAFAAVRGYSTYGEVNTTLPHVLRFSCRMDTTTGFTSTTDSIEFHDKTTAAAGVNTTVSWLIRAYGAATGTAAAGQWAFYNGAQNNGSIPLTGSTRWQSSGMAVTPGTVYSFVVFVDPPNKQWSASINNGTTTVTSGTLGFNRNATEVGSFFHFAGAVSGGNEVRTQSLDTVSISSAEVPLIFTSSKSALPADLITLHGARFVVGTSQPQVWIDQITGTTDAPNPEIQIPIVSSSSTLIHAEIPASLPVGLYAVFVKCGGAVSAPVWVNQSEAWQILDLVGSQCDPNRVFRVSGWNMDLPGATSVVYFQNTSTLARISAPVSNLDKANLLTITAPASIVPGQSYQLVISNGYGGTQGETYGPILSCVATPVDALGLGVPWADEFAFAADPTKIYNVKNAPYNAVGDGVANDRPAISAACTAAFNAGGGCVYLPAGTYNLQIPVIELESQSYTVSSGDTRTVIADALCSAGYYTSLTADAVGDYISFTANIPLAGTYEINVSGKASPTQGKAKLLIDGVQVGGTWDQYDTTVTRDSTSFGTTSLTAGNHTFRFEVTGKNTVSTGYNLALDSLAAKYTLKPNKRVVLRGAGIDVTTVLGDIAPYAVHSTNGSVFHNGNLDMTVNGQLSWGTGGTPNSGPVIVVRVRVNNPPGNGALLVNGGKVKTLVKDCSLLSGSSCFQGIGADNLLVKNCTMQWSAGRIVAYTGRDLQVDGCTMTRYVTGNPDIVVTFGGWEVSKRDNLAILNCVFNKAGVPGPIIQHNDGETILNQGVPRLGAGMVTSATATTLTDTVRAWTTDQLSANNAYAVIVAGTGQGQWRKIISNTSNTATLESPWDIIPSTDSAYTITWKDEHWLIAENTFQNCPRPTWLYSCTMTDVAIVDNDYINSADIYLRCDQRLTDEHGRFNLFRNILIAGNEVLNTDHVYPSQISCQQVVPNTEFNIGNGFWDVTIRDNAMDSIRPSLTIGNDYGVNGEGYFAVGMGMGSKLDGKQAVKGVVFDKNLAIDLDKAFNTSTGAMQTTIWKPTLSNVGALWTDVIMSGATQGSIQTVVQP